MTTYKQAEEIAADIAGVKKEYVIMSKFSPVPFAEEILKNHKMIYDCNKILWRYDKEEGLWLSDAHQFIKTTLRKDLMGDEQQKKNYVDEIIAYIKDFTYDGEFEMNSDPYLIPLKNKVYDIRSGSFMDFSEKFYFSNKLDITINGDNQKCDLIDKFFGECIGEKHKDMLYELIAYTLFKDIPFQKLFFIYGPAGTGKTIFMSLLEHFLGKKNYCSVEPRIFSKDIHATSQMEHKYANICSDINYDDFDNITMVKKLTGGDTVTIRRLYQNAYNTKLFTKQIFSTNKLPVIKEKTKAWYRRVYLLDFCNIIPTEKRDLFLLQKLCNEKEITGLTIKCLEKLRELYLNKFRFTWDMDENKMQEVYEELSNPILMFIKENCTEERGKFVFKWEFDERLNNWLKNNHFPTHVKSEINKYMREKYNESNRNVENTIKTYRVWTGLRWKENTDNTQFNGFNHFNQVRKKVYIYRGILQTPTFPLNPLDLVKKEEKSNKNDK